MAQTDSIRMDINMPSPQASGNRKVADIKKKTLRSRLLSVLFGDKHEVVIIMPSQNVSNVTFTREREKAGADE